MKYAFAIITTIICFQAFGQKQTAFGFFGELIRRDNRVYIKSNPPGSQLESGNKFGLAVGANAYMFLNAPISLRVSPALSLEIDQVTHRFKGDSGSNFLEGYEQYQYGTIYLKLPVHGIIPLGTLRKLNLAGGMTGFIPLTSANPPFETEQWDLTADLGVSYALNLGDLIIRPEVKYSLGLISAIKPDGINHLIYNSEARIYRNRISLGLFFVL